MPVKIHGNAARVSPTQRRRRFLVALGVVFLLSGTLTALHQREVHIDERYAALPRVVEGDLGTLRVRLAGLEELIERYPFSRVTFRAGREKHELQVEHDRLEIEHNRAQRSEEARESERRSQAESLRYTGLELARDEDYVGARDALRKALEVDLPDWDMRERVELDLQAIEAWLEQGGGGR